MDGTRPPTEQAETEQAETKQPADPGLRARSILSILSAVLLLAGVGVGGWVLRDWPAACGGRPMLVSIAVAPDIAPAIMQVASRFNVQTHEVRGRCVRLDVFEQDSAQAARSLAGQSPGGERLEIDGWVPESSMWTSVARSSVIGATAVSPGGTSVASSPVVLATPRPVAEELRRKRIPAGWRMLFPDWAGLFGGPRSKVNVSVQILDPAGSATGIATMVAARKMIGNDRASAAVLTSLVRGLQRNVAADTSTLFTYLTGLASIGRPIVVASEQAVVDYNEVHRRNPAAALIPAEGTILLDYPFVITTRDPARREAAEAFRWALRSRTAHDAIQRIGFRTPEGLLDREVVRRHELHSSPPDLLSRPQPGQVYEALQAWNRLGLGTRILVLADVSGSMLEQVPGRGQTRMQVATRAALTGLQLFPDDTDIGLWEFSTELDGRKDYRQRVSLGPVTERIKGKRTRRQELHRITVTIRPKPTGDTGLYDSVLAAYRRVKRGWRPDKFNTVLVLTDGNNDDDHGISLSELLATLRRETDPQRPVQVITVAFGPEVDPTPMERITRATGGASYVTRDPGQIVNVFMEAIARRLCNPDCPS